MTPSPQTTKTTPASSTPNGKNQQPKFLISVNGASANNSPTGEIYHFKTTIFYTLFNLTNDSAFVTTK